MYKIKPFNLIKLKKLESTNSILSRLPIPSSLFSNIIYSKKVIKNILLKRDIRKLIIIGPCSMQSSLSCLEFSFHIKKLSNKYNKYFFYIMRFYYEKPRTSVGWKGLVIDPLLNYSFNINQGLQVCRYLLIKSLYFNISLATEILNTSFFEYFNDLYSWSAIGARTSESQIHREFISTLSIPVGIKNTTYGDISVSLNAKNASIHNSISININNSNTSLFYSSGNKWLHIILRGGLLGPNYGFYSLKKIKSLNYNNIIIDCNHGNSLKKYYLQKYIINKYKKIKIQLNISGFMIESNIFSKQQKVQNIFSLKYGISITDSCSSIIKIK